MKVCFILLTNLSVECAHLDCFQLVAIIHKAIISIHMEVPTWALVFTYIAQTPTSEIARSHVKCPFNCQDTIKLPVGCVILHSRIIGNARIPFYFSLFEFVCFVAVVVVVVVVVVVTVVDRVFCSPTSFKLYMCPKMSRE